jgi:hypothetical protein
VRKLFERLAGEFRWERADYSMLYDGLEGTWHGHAVKLVFAGGGEHFDNTPLTPKIRAEIDVRSPQRFVIRRRHLLGLDIDLAGPEVIDVQPLPGFRVRADSAEFAQSLLSDEHLRERILGSRNLEEIRATWRIEVDIALDGWWRSEATVEPALREAWTIATTVVEKLRL